MKCLLIGGGGFMGSHLCEALVAKSYKVRVLERARLNIEDIPRNVFARLEWIEGDFTNSVDLESTMKGCDIVFDFANSILPKNSNDNPNYDVESNVIPSLQMLDLAKYLKVKRIIFISSGGTVYGIPQKIPIPEIHPTNPLCSYGISKLTIEKYLYLYKHLYGLDYSILRVSNAFGERQLPNLSQGVIATFLYKALRNEVIEIWGNGSIIRDYIYIQDIIDALMKAMVNKNSDKIFNIGCGKGLSINEVIVEIEYLTKHPLKKLYTEGRLLDVQENVLDISKANKFLNWSPKITFREGLEKTYNWMRQKYLTE